MSVFTPTILALNYPHASAIRIQLLSVPPNMSVSLEYLPRPTGLMPFSCAWVFSITLIYLAMRYKMHAAAALVGVLLTIIGYGTWVATDATYIKTRYACLFLNTMGGCYGAHSICVSHPETITTA